MRVFLAFLAGAVASYLAIVLGASWYMDAAGIHDRDGGMAMALVFAIGPLGALAGGTVAALIAYLSRSSRPKADSANNGARSSRPKADSANNGARSSRPKADSANNESRATRIGLTAVLAGAAGYLVGWLGLWLQTGTSYESYWTALLVTWAPILLGLAAAGLATWLAAPARA